MSVLKWVTREIKKGILEEKQCGKKQGHIMEVILSLAMKSNMKYIEIASNKDHVHNVEKYVLSKDVKRAT